LLVNQAVNLGADTISIFGYGEPLLDTGIDKKIAHCSDLGLFTFITTNASLLKTDVSNQILKAGLSKIRFSVHGVHDNYSKVHRGLNWDVVSRNISNFLAMNKIKYSGQCKTSVSVIPMNDESVDDIRSIWENHVDELEIWQPHNWGGVKQYRSLTKDRKRTCGRPEKGPVQIMADGQMIICCFDFDGKMVVGDTYKNTIEEILKSEQYNFYRENHKLGIHEKTLCDTCDQLNIGDNPLLYSSVDSSLSIGKTSSTKFGLE